MLNHAKLLPPASHLASAQKPQAHSTPPEAYSDAMGKAREAHTTSPVRGLDTYYVVPGGM